MRCRACGVELIAGKPFCHACGEAVALRCGQCGAALEATFRFCPECGSAVEAAGETPAPAPPPPRTAPPGDGERRLVTVLFCDLVGSTALADGLDPEDFHDLLEKYLAVAFPAVYRFDGVVNQLAGDGLLALFGAPVAHEDDPQRAVRAALAVRDAVHGLAERLSAAGGPSLTVRIGVHTGPVVVGSFGTDLKTDYTAIGDTTNLAARLQGVAEPGAILISEATQRLVRGFFDLRFAGTHDIRGKAEPVRAYEVLGRRTHATAMSVAAARGLTPYVGREAELSQLESCFEQLGRGRSQVVTVVGGAGSGKSRLLFELRRRLQGEPVTFFEAYSSSLGGEVLYHPVLGMLRRYFGLEATDSPAEKTEKLAARLGFGFDHLEQMYPRFSRFLELPGEERGDAPGDELKRETFDAVGRLLVGRSAQEPVVVFLEDLQWYDRASRELLGDLVGRLERSRIMVVGTCRPETAVTWRTRAMQTEIALAPLPDDEVRAIARAVIGTALPRSLEDLVVARAAGSPFFAEELTRALVEEGWVVREPEGGVRLARPVRELPVPGTVQEVIAARLDRLPAEARRVLQVAAVLGRSFRAPDVAELLEDESVDVPAALGELETRGLLHSKLAHDGDELRFGESLTREVAYEGLLLRQRRQLHERVARLLERRAADGGPHRAALLAHHLALSDDRERAVYAMLEAARGAQEVPSYETAAELFRRAALLAENVLAEHDEPGMRAAALEGHFCFVQLTVLFGLPLMHEASDAAARARELAEAEGDSERLSSLLYFQGVLSLSIPGGDFAAGLALAEQGVRLATESGLDLQADRLRRGLAINYALDGRFDEARGLADSILRRFEVEDGDGTFSDAHLSARWVKAFVMYTADQLDEAMRFAQETSVVARRARNRTIECIIATMIAQMHLLRAEYAQAIACAERALELAEAIGNVNAYPGAAAVALAARRELGEAVETRRYLELIERGLDPGGLVQMNFRFVSDAWLAAGAVEAGLVRLADMARTGGGRVRRALLALSRGDLLAAQGDTDGARAAYDETLALAREMSARSVFVQAAVGRLTLGRLDGAEHDVLPLARRWCEELRLERYRPHLLRAIAGRLVEATPLAASS